MTATQRAAMQQALGALESDNPDIQLRAAIALRAALAEPEPVAWEQFHEHLPEPFYASPQQQAAPEPVAFDFVDPVSLYFAPTTIVAQQAEPTPSDATAGLLDDLCLLHMGWKADAEGDLYRAAWDRVIARAAEVRRLRLIKQLKAQVGKGEER